MDAKIAPEVITEAKTKRRVRRASIIIRVFEIGVILLSFCIGISSVFLLCKISLCPTDPFSRNGILFYTAIPIVVTVALVELYARRVKSRVKPLTRHGFSFLEKKNSPEGNEF